MKKTIIIIPKIGKSNTCLLLSLQVDDQSPATVINSNFKKLVETAACISRDETSSHGVECRFKVLSQCKKFLFHCSVCDQRYKAGPAHQNLQNLRLHIKSKQNKSNLTTLRKAKGLAEETNQKETSEIAFKELEKEFSGQFLLKSTSAACRDCPDVAINLVSNRGGKPTTRAK